MRILWQGWNKSMVHPVWQQNPYIDARKRRKHAIWRNIRKRQQKEKRKRVKSAKWTKVKSNKKRGSPKKQTGQRNRDRSREKTLSATLP